MRSSRGEKRNHKLLLQVGAVVAVLFLIAILVNAFAIFSDRMQTFMNEKQEDYAVQLAFFDEVIADYINWQWLLTYVQEHYAELSLDGMSYEDYAPLWSELIDRYPGVAFEEMTPEELSALPQEDQHILGTFFCLLLEDLLQTVGSRMDLDEILLCIPVGETEEFVVARYSRDETREGTDAEAEQTSHVTGPGEVKHSKVSWDSVHGEDEIQFIYSPTDSSIYLFLYHPLTYRGQTSAYFSIYFELTETFHKVMQSILNVESFTVQVLLITAAVILLLLYLIAVRPLVFVQRAVRQYKESKDSGTVLAYTEKLRSRNEVGLLAHDIADMTVEIDRFTEEVGRLSGEREHIRTELAIASKIQLQMLSTDFPKRREFALEASITPAREVGGDFYDFFFLDEDHLALVMGDVSGKGVPASLFMVAAMLQIRNIAMADRDYSPAAILNRVNDQLAKNNKEMMFVTVWLGIITISTGAVVETNAGHENPALRRNGGDFAYIERNHGLVLGAMAGVKYQEDSFTLLPGDSLFIYTDGLPDASNGEGERLGHERALEYVNRCRNDSAEDFLAHLHNDVDAYVDGAESFDDLTLMAFHWFGNGTVGGDDTETETETEEEDAE